MRLDLSPIFQDPAGLKRYLQTNFRRIQELFGQVEAVAGAAGAHPNLAAHDTLGLATQSELDAHAATSGHTHPDLTAHDNLGLATQAELDAHANAADPHSVYETSAEAAAKVTAHEAAADPHTGYQKESEKGAVNGYASLDAGGTVPDAQIPAAIARDSEVTTAVNNHASASDPHTGYLQESIVDVKGDLIVATAADTLARQPVGANATFLKANSAVTNGIEWATLADADIPAAIARDSEVTSAIGTHEAAADPHTGYQRESEKGVANGYASLDAGGTVPDAQIPAAIARDSEVTTSVNNHAAAADPHTGYVLESLIDAKGDLILGTAADVVGRKAVGANNTFLKADSADSTGVVWAALVDADIPASIARDSEVTTAISNHEAAADPHTGYQRESEKAVANGYASLDAGGTIPDAQIPAAITRDSELSAHTSAGSPHTDHVKGTIRITVGTVAPSSPAVNDIWVDSN